MGSTERATGQTTHSMDFTPHTNITEPDIMKLLVLVLVAFLEVVRGDYREARVQMIQRQSCYYEPHNKMLTCRCTNYETITFLELKLMFFMKEKGQQVSSVVITSCPDVMMALDLTGVNPTNIPVNFKNCGK